MYYVMTIIYIKNIRLVDLLKITQFIKSTFFNKTFQTSTILDYFKKNFHIII